MQSNANGNVLYKIKEMFSEKVLKDDCYQHVSEYEHLEAIFIVSGMIGVLEEWLLSSLEMTLEQISTLLHQLLVKFD